MVSLLGQILSEGNWNCERALIYDLAKEKNLVVWGVQQCTLWRHPTGLSNKEGILGGNRVRTQHSLENTII